MIISINWLKDFVDLSGITNKEIIKRVTLSTAEIEEVIEKGKDLKGVVVGQITEVKPHPESKKLSVLKVTNGKKTLQVVCGAPNCREGLKVAWVMPGGIVEGHEIGTASLKGIESHGMCLSGRELGISEDHDGIIELPDAYELGIDVKEYLDLEDTLFEIDNKSLTNRPDLWNHYGIAREVAAIFNKQLKPLELDELEGSEDLPKINIKIKDQEKCFRYSGLRLGNVTKKVSPINMQIRLFYAGMRSLNLLADLSNYVMLEMGQPMHAFDGRKATEIVVDTPKSEIDFKTLDGEEKKIDKDTLLIYEKDTPVAIAGIMGGLESEVEDDTTSILLESANFDATSTRKSATKLGLRTEASLRYEKCLDPELTVTAIKRFTKLLKNIDENVKVESALTDEYAYKYPHIKLEITKDYVEKYIGVKLSLEEIKDILTRLGFGVGTLLGEVEALMVMVPTFRATKDVSLKADLVEEVARIYGYDNITPEPVTLKTEPVVQEIEHIKEYEAKKLLASKYALNEVHTYIWNNDSSNKELKINTKTHLGVLNSTVADDQIRSALTPSLLKIVNENKNTDPEIGIFEIARVVTGINKDNTANERKHLNIVLTSKTKTEEQLYLQLKEVIEVLNLQVNNLKIEYDLDKEVNEYLHPVNSAQIVVAGNVVGQMGVLHPVVTESMDKKLNVVCLEIDFSLFAEVKESVNKVELVSKYQTTSLDFSFLANKDLYYAEIQKHLNQFKTDLNKELKLVDVFEDESLNEKISYTVNFVIGSSDHTLKAQEIDEFYNGVIDHAKKLNLELRK